MRTQLRFVIRFVLVICLVNTTLAQDSRPADQTTALPVTASASSARVRFTAPSSVVQIRLEVYNGTGKKVFDNEVRGGNVLDWHLQDGQAEPIADDTYLCAVTVKNLAGKLAQRIGSVSFEKGVASVKAADVSHMTGQQIEALGPVEEDAALVVLKGDEGVTPTVIAHNGEEGQIVRGRGALSFRLGDFFRGKDIEQMRLTAEGNLGIGVANPGAKLDVAGAIRASQGIMFPDGSIQFSAARKTFGTPSHRGQSQEHAQEEEPRPSIAGSGTTGQIPKWQDGPNGLLSDSVISEFNGSIGINGTPNPIFKLDVSGHNRFRGSNVSFYLTGVKPGGNEWLFQTVDADGRLRVFDNTSGAERFSIAQSGNVGIGTSAPISPLHVAAPIPVLRLQDTNNSDAGQVGLVSFLNAVGVETGWIGFGTSANANAHFMNNRAGGNTSLGAGGLEWLTVTSSGDVGIGTTTPQAKLDVRGDITIAPKTRVKSIHGASFIPVGINVPDDFVVARYTGAGMDGAGAPETGYIAPVELPDGALVTEFCIDAFDSRINDISATLGRTSLSTGGTNTMGITFTSGTSSSVQRPCISPIDFGQVNNNSSAYWILVKIFSRFDGAGTHRLISARIKYQITQPLP